MARHPEIKIAAHRRLRLMPEALFRKSLPVILLILISMDAMAQSVVLGVTQSTHAAAFNLGSISHVYVGSAEGGEALEYRGIGFGLSYIGPQLRATGLFARENGTFVDLSASGWLLPSFAKIERRNTTIAIPIGFLIGWRRVTVRNDNTAPLGVNAILFGTGGTLMHSLNSRTRFELRAMPLAGITGSQVADAVGFSWAVDTEARLEFANIFTSFGLTIGYTFRYQFWNVNGSRAFSDAIDDLYDYAGNIQTVSVGIWF